MSNAPTKITFTPALRDAFQSAYDHAIANEQDKFNWHGHAYVTNYAKYLLQHLDNQFA